MKATLDDFKKLDIRIGVIMSVERVPDTDKLLRLEVDLGEEKYRHIISGIAEYFEDIESLVGKRCPFVVNLEPKTIRGYESNGMILAVSADDNTFSLLEAGMHIPAGSTIK
ncbi:hypothetical protein IIC45_00660 [Patescibacteria group bacterium]|nr:hypothetical protein [Patescibacteria group bacterium]